MHLYKAQDDLITLYLTPADCQRLATICLTASAAPGLTLAVIEKLFDLAAAFLTIATANVAQHIDAQPASQDPLAQSNKEKDS